MRTNGYDAATGVLTVSNDRAAAMAATAVHYRALFGGDASLVETGATLAVTRDGERARIALPAGMGQDAVPVIRWRLRS